ncbi:hypothetical protein VB715_11520 [Crocosphaera sp. UHCC 0190]|uniref:hypothetical protein n=1 Tax=Crocosphaera sp. UHCC 0190 TaxID=3110246 RepID=UPI002B21E97D|nr:hypothetical protein [Crocosphaera sp. UHCC 0190]MEA5510394.1 hypothetical protein [Crocosphaera sp. UHCC 0190]
MSKVTANDLQELKDLINSGFTEIKQDIVEVRQDIGNVKQDISNVKQDIVETRQDISNVKQDIVETRQDISNVKQDITELKEDINGIDKQIGIVDARLDEWKPSIHKISDLAEKVGELKNWRQIVIITITATISGAIGWIIRGGSLKP